MSNIYNDRLAESLFERLEDLEPAMNLPEYADKQSELLRLIADGSFEEAAEHVLDSEGKYAGLLADTQARDALEAQGAEVF